MKYYILCNSDEIIDFGDNPLDAMSEYVSLLCQDSDNTINPKLYAENKHASRVEIPRQFIVDIVSDMNIAKERTRNG